MTVASNQPENVLPYESAAYQTHKEFILDARRRARELELLTQATHDGIFDVTKGIVCDRERVGQHLPSVSKSYFRAALDLQLKEGDPRHRDAARTEDIRRLAARVLAIKLSIAERPLEDPHEHETCPVECYTDLILDLEEHCKSHRIPSVLPNMLLASSLFTQLKQRSYVIGKNDGKMEFYSKLTQIFAYHDRHLHAITTQVLRQGKHREAMELITVAATMRHETLGELFEKNPPLADVFIAATFESGNYEETASLCEKTGLAVIGASPVCAEKYLRSLGELNRLEDMVAFMEHLPTDPDGMTPSLSKAVGIACESIGWWRFGCGLYEEGLAFLDRFASHEIGPKGRRNMNDLYLQLLEGVGDLERIALFKQRIGVS